MQTFIIFYDYDYGQREKAYISYAKGKRNSEKNMASTQEHLFTHFPLDWAVAVVMAHAKANNAKNV